MIRLFIGEIADSFISENFKKISDYFTQNVWDRGKFFFLEYEFKSAVTNMPVSHTANFTPKDVILLSVSGGQTVSFSYDLFDKNNIYVTTSGPCKIRAFVGRYSEVEV